jgi:hypothetical protein
MRNMEEPLEDLSASALRNLLIEEVKQFILSLDYSSTAELEKSKLFLRRIYELIQQKENAENSSLNWGKKSPGANTKTPSGSPNGDSTSSGPSG